MSWIHGICLVTYCLMCETCLMKYPGKKGKKLIEQYNYEKETKAVQGNYYFGRTRLSVFGYRYFFVKCEEKLIK